MIILFAFLAGMSFVIALAACLAAHRERERAKAAETALTVTLAGVADHRDGGPR